MNISLALLLLSTFVIVTSEKTFVAKATAIKCNHSEKFLTNLTCKIKAVKGKFGLVTATATPITTSSDIKLHFKLFYRFGSVHFRPWMMNFDKDVCVMSSQFMKGTLQKESTITLAAYESLKKAAPNFVHECPYQRGIESGVENFDVDAFMPNVIPQLIPVGDYRVLMRLHTSTNETIVEVWLTMNVDAIDKIKAYGMG